MARPPRRRAFTLIELILVIATLALLSAIAVPRWSAAAQRYQADFAAQRIASDLSAARGRANYGSSPVTVTFNVTTSSYQVTGIPDTDHPTGNYTVTLSSPPYRARLTSASFGGAAAVTFDGYGTPSQGGAVVVTVGGRSRTITIDGTSGATTIQ